MVKRLQSRAAPCVVGLYAHLRYRFLVTLSSHGIVWEWPVSGPRFGVSCGLQFESSEGE